MNRKQSFALFAFIALIFIAIVYLVHQSNVRTEVSAVVTARNWSITTVVESQQNFQERMWQSECTGADCRINQSFGVNDCTSEYTGRDNVVTDKTKVTEHAPICQMVDDLTTARQETDYSNCDDVPNPNSCHTEPDLSNCELDENDNNVCGEKTVCDTKTVCQKKTVYDQKKVCEDQPDTYGTSATPINENKCNVTVTRWVQDGSPYQTSGTYDVPHEPVVIWNNHRFGARTKSVDLYESATFTQSDGKVVPWDQRSISFSEAVWNSLRQEESVTLVYNGFGSLVEIKLPS